MSKLSVFLSEPAVLLSTRQKLKAYAFIGIFTFVFFLFFQPFGVNNYNPKETITVEFFVMMIIFCSYITAVLLLNDFVISRPLKPYLRYRWQWCLWLLWSLVFISTLIFLFYNWLGEWHDFSWSSWVEFIINISTMGILPLGLVYMYARMRQQGTHHLQGSGFTSAASTLLSFPADNQKDMFTLTLERVLFLESEDNYVAIHYRQEDKRQKKLIRMTLKRIDEMQLHPALIRCHRSYIVNLFHLQEFQGNQQQGNLYLKHVEAPFPVSKTYTAAVLQHLS